jgi:methyltransferase
VLGGVLESDRLNHGLAGRNPRGDGSFRPVPASRIAFLVLYALVALERLAELVVSRRNARRAFARGGVEAESRSFYRLMVTVHALFLVAAPLEVVFARRPLLAALAVPMLALSLAAQALRWWAVATLGERWNTRVIVVPGATAIAAGPYRRLRHPNYVAVVVESVALPLVHTAWIAALVFGVANVLLVRRRIAHEETALARLADYRQHFGGRRRFLPGGA